MKNLKPTILFFLLIALSMSVYSQDNFKPGYAITLTGDTLFGEINYKGDTEMGRICTFKQADGEIIRYTSNELVEYHFPGLKYFVSKEYKGLKFFFEFLIKGRVNVYYIRDDNGDHYFIENDELGLTEIPYVDELRIMEHNSSDRRVKAGQEYRYKSKHHLGILSLYMQDAPNIDKYINNIKKPQHKNLTKLAQKYNDIVCDDACIIYEKKLPKIGVNVEIIGGTFMSRKGKYLGAEWRGPNAKSAFLHGGVLTHIWMPRSNENIYFKTGLLVSDIKTQKEYDYWTKKTEQKDFILYKIPIQVEYLYPRDTFIRPKIAGGINVYSPSKVTFAATVGVNIRLTKKFYWTINYDADFERSTIIVPKAFYSHAVTSGLYIVFD